MMHLYTSTGKIVTPFCFCNAWHCVSQVNNRCEQQLVEETHKKLQLRHFCQVDSVNIVLHTIILIRLCLTTNHPFANRGNIRSALVARAVQPLVKTFSCTLTTSPVLISFTYGNIGRLINPFLSLATPTPTSHGRGCSETGNSIYSKVHPERRRLSRRYWHTLRCAPCELVRSLTASSCLQAQQLKLQCKCWTVTTANTK